MKCIKCNKDFFAKEKRYTLCDECYEKFSKSEPTDYQLCVNKDTPENVRRNMDIWDIRSNSIRCNKCWDIIRSKNRHNFIMCKCDNCWTDWWSWYCRRIGNDYTDLTELFTDVIN